MIINPYIFGVASTLNTGLYAVYNADNTPNDSFGSNNGTLINDATYATGKINQAFSFDGVNDYFVSNANTSTFTDFTISTWIKPNSFASTFSILCCEIQDFGWRMQCAADGSILLRRFTGAGAFVDLTTAVNTLTSAVFYNIVFTQEAGIAKIYVNDTLVGTGGSATISYTAGHDFSLGVAKYDAALFAFYLNGLQDATAIWSRVLTPTEITELYNSGNGKQYPY